MKIIWQYKRRDTFISLFIRKLKILNMKTISLIFLALCAVCVAVADEEVNALGWPAEYSLTPRIVNGTDAEKGQFPYQVSLRFRLNDAHFCGGSILTDRFILTAAHCNQGFTASPMLVYAILGAYRRTKGGIEYALDKITPHQEWDGAKIKNDISLLRTAKKITFNEYIQPIALPTQETPSDTEVVLSGWGHYVVSFINRSLVFKAAKLICIN